MKSSEIEMIHYRDGRGKGAYRVVHKPTGISVQGVTGGESNHRIRERLLEELADKVPPEGVKMDAWWLSLSVRKLVTAIAADHTFDRLPILADALEEAGCDNGDILAHLRGPGPHFSQCWALALLRGME